MRLDALLPFVAFWALVVVHFASGAHRARFGAKRRDDLVLDVLGLLVQGGLIPVLALFVIARGLTLVAPGLHGALALPAPLAFLLHFVVVDYLYYWNHRLLHRPALWPVHRVHHSLTDMDVLGTSRNPLWASFLIVYVWVNGAFLYLLADPWPYAWSIAVTAALDLWRHSSLGPRRGSALWRVLSSVIITPADHAWHHSRDAAHGNYGANLSLWDRLHGTWITAAEDAPALGIDDGLSLSRRLLWPFS